MSEGRADIRLCQSQKNDRLIVSGAADNQGESMEDLTAMVRSLRLDVEVDDRLSGK
jgi:hypothetical protein